MLKLFSYLKPYILFIIICTVLLFIQANMELALPDYMSRIVNVGIQQEGIDSPVPDAMRGRTFEKIVPLLDENIKEIVLISYMKVTADSELFSTYEHTYPVLKQEPVYILQDTSIKKNKTIASEISKALLMLPGMNLTGDKPDTPATLPFSDSMMIIQNGIIAVKQEYAAMGMDISMIRNSFIIRTGGIMIIFTLISAIATILVGLIASRTAAGLARNVRKDVFTKIEYFSGEEFDRFSTASLITRSTNDITQLQMFIFIMLRLVFYAPIIGIGGVIRAMGKAPSMAWIIGLAVLILLFVIIIIIKFAMPKFKIMQKLIDKLNLVARENLSGLMVVRAFNQQEFEEKRFDTSNTELTETNLFILRVMVIMMPLMMLIMNLLSVIIIWVGAQQIAASVMQVGDMMAFLQYAMQIVMSFLMLSMIFIFLPRASVSLQRVKEVLETRPSITDPIDPKKFTDNPESSIQFNNVCFRYPGAEKDALHNINFIIKPGKTTAIIGSTGSGKSTIVKLILRFYDVCGGEIEIDGINIKDMTQHDLRCQIGYVPQKITLFSGTIESNLKYADEHATSDTMRKAAEIAQAMEFINDKDEKFASPIAQSGTNISGGQKQRLSIARALVKEFPIYIFDDSFSALDFKTDAALRRALKNKTGKSTLIIIAQRISTIMNAEQIIVLDKGKIVGKGTHKELLQTCTEYKEIALSQLEIKELS